MPEKNIVEPIILHARDCRCGGRADIYRPASGWDMCPFGDKFGEIRLSIPDWIAIGRPETINDINTTADRGLTKARDAALKRGG